MISNLAVKWYLSVAKETIKSGALTIRARGQFGVVNSGKGDGFCYHSLSHNNKTIIVIKYVNHPCSIVMYTQICVAYTCISQHVCMGLYIDCMCFRLPIAHRTLWLFCCIYTIVFMPVTLSLSLSSETAQNGLQSALTELANQAALNSAGALCLWAWPYPIFQWLLSDRAFLTQRLSQNTAGI